MPPSNDRMPTGTLVSAIACGGVGGMAPSLLDLAGMARAGEMPANGYFLAMAIFAFLGGFVAAIYKEHLTHKAFFLGIGAPALIVAGGSVTDQIAVIPSVHAQAVESAQELGSTRLMLVPMQVKGVRADLGAAKLKVITPTGVMTVPLRDAGQSTPGAPPGLDANKVKLAQIPDDATAVFLDGVYVLRGDSKDGPAQRVQTTPSAVPVDGEVLQVTFGEHMPFWSGFYSAIGMNRASRGLYSYPTTVERVAAVVEAGEE